MNPLVSVIIPAYNVECYVKHTIESVINQTYKNIEVILVDDGSIDRTSDICDYYQERDKRVTVIHQTNQGLSEARNIGTCNASGDFVFYLDGDDYLEENAIENLVKLADGYDLVIGNYYYTYSDHEDIATSVYSQLSVLDKETAMHDLLVGEIQNFAWGKLIKTDIAKKHIFPKAKLFEDTYWAHLIVDECEKICITNEPCVHYRQRHNSISYSINIKRLDVLEGWEERAKFVEANYPKFYANYMTFISSILLELAWQTLTKMSKRKYEALNKLGEFSDKYDLKRYATRSNRVLIEALGFNTLLYIFLAIIFRAINRKKA